MHSTLRTLLFPLCGLAALMSVGSQAADTPSKAPQDAPSGQSREMPSFHGEEEGMPHFPPMGMMMPPPPMHAFCHGGELFCASVASDNPTDTLQKLNGVIPAATAGKHYEVRVSVVEVPDFPHPGQQGNKPEDRK